MIRWVHDNIMHTSVPRSPHSCKGAGLKQTHTQVRGLSVGENRESGGSKHLVSQAKSHPPDLEEHLCSDLGFKVKS